MFRKTYRSMNEQIAADSTLIARTLGLTTSTQNTRQKSGPGYRRPLAVALTFVLCIAVAAPALAANVPGFYEMIYRVSPQVAQHFAPVQQSCEDNGIRLEVVSAYIHDNTAEIYVAMQDLVGTRVDGTTDLFDSYSIHRAFDSSATCQRIGYDEETKTATFLILITGWGNQKITGSKLTFSVREFISHKSALEDAPVGIDLATVTDVVATQTISAVGRSGVFPVAKEPNNSQVLVPGASICSPINGIDVTAIGYVDGALHVQLATSDKTSLDNHGYFYLMGENGQRLQYDSSVSFVEGIDSNNRVDYQEFLFDIPSEQIANYTLFGSFYTGGLNTKGNWRVTFPLVKGHETE